MTQEDLLCDRCRPQRCSSVAINSGGWIHAWNVRVTLADQTVDAQLFNGPGWPS